MGRSPCSTTSVLIMEGRWGRGVVEKGMVVCPWHAYAFDAHTGVCEHQPKLAVKVYEAQIEGDEVLITL